MNRLPNETLVKILGYLNYDELLDAKNVCKLWREAVGYVIERSTIWAKEENQLICNFTRQKDDENLTPFYKLFYENQNGINKVNGCLISRNWKKFRLITGYHCKIKKLILSNPFLINFLTTFENLEHLELLTESWITKEFQIDLKRQHIEQIQHLEHLELIDHSFESLDDVFIARGYRNSLNGFRREDAHDIFLNLANLKTLYFISDFNFKKVSIYLCCPNLKSIITDVNLAYFKLKFPYSVEEITCEENNLSLCLFRNLKKLTCFYLNSNNMSFLNFLKNLKELHFHKIDDAFINFNLNHVKFFYKNVQFLPNQTWQSNLRKISALTLNDSSLEFYSRNFKYMSETTDLMQKELRANNFKYANLDLIKKLSNLKVFYITYDQLDKEHYVEVMRTANLDKLIIKSSFISTVDQQFLDLIPIHCPILTSISIDDFNNLNFILGLKYLKSLKTEQFFDFDLLRKLFDYLHYLNQVQILITVDIFKFKLVDNRIFCSYNDEEFLEQNKSHFISPSNRKCIWKLYQLFITNYK